MLYTTYERTLITKAQHVETTEALQLQ